MVLMSIQWRYQRSTGSDVTLYFMGCTSGSFPGVMEGDGREMKGKSKVITEQFRNVQKFDRKQDMLYLIAQEALREPRD